MLIWNSRFMTNWKVYISKIVSINEDMCPLSSVVEMNIHNSHYCLDKKKVEQYKYLRGRKKLRKHSDGTKYYYSEGTTNRSTHIICEPTTNELRLLTPIEC